jgi:RES domain-containing protein
VKLLWRIASETRDYKADDLSGFGAAKQPGRWNRLGEAMIYASTHRSLAILETSANLGDFPLPLNRFLVKINVPGDVWAKRKSMSSTGLPPTWRAIPPGAASADVGSSWHKSVTSALLLVPSAIVEEEFNVLINPNHPDAASISASVIRPFEYNKLFRTK